MPDSFNSKFPKASVSPMPFFVHIKETIRKQILDGTYSVHDKLPSERELIESFNVSRITVVLVVCPQH